MKRTRSFIRYVATLAVIGLLTVGGLGRAPAYGQGRPNPQIAVIPDSDLADGQSVEVWGTGFQSNQEIALIECGAEVTEPPFRGAICGDYAVAAHADDDGNFGPVSFTVTTSITGSRWEKGKYIPAAHDCASTSDCYIHAYALTRALLSANGHLNFIE